MGVMGQLLDHGMAASLCPLGGIIDQQYSQAYGQTEFEFVVFNSWNRVRQDLI